MLPSGLVLPWAWPLEMQAMGGFADAAAAIAALEKGGGIDLAAAEGRAAATHTAAADRKEVADPKRQADLRQEDMFGGWGAATADRPAAASTAVRADRSLPRNRAGQPGTGALRH